MAKSNPRKKYTPEEKKKRARIARQNLEKARAVKKEKAQDKYLKQLEEDINYLENMATSAMEDMPKEVYAQVRKVIEHELTQKDFNKFLAHDLMKAYAEMGGREQLKKHVRSDPTKFMQFMTTLTNVVKQTQETGQTNNGVQVVIKGLDDKNVEVSTTGESRD